MLGIFDANMMHSTFRLRRFHRSRRYRRLRYLENLNY